jgi:hypothetical protein
MIAGNLVGGTKWGESFERHKEAVTSEALEQEARVSRKSATIFGKGTIPELSKSHIGKGVALAAQTAAFVYIYVRIPQIAEMTLSFYATTGQYWGSP